MDRVAEALSISAYTMMPPLSSPGGATQPLIDNPRLENEMKIGTNRI